MKDMRKLGVKLKPTNVIFPTRWKGRVFFLSFLFLFSTLTPLFCTQCGLGVWDWKYLGVIHWVSLRIEQGRGAIVVTSERVKKTPISFFQYFPSSTKVLERKGEMGLTFDCCWIQNMDLSVLLLCHALTWKQHECNYRGKQSQSD